MDAYCELQILPDPEFPSNLLMNGLFAKLHRALVNTGEGRIGISFPDVEKNKGTLGERLRLHGSAEDLKRLNDTSWLQGMRDHLLAGEIRAVPADTGYRIVSRIQAKSSPERLRRRAVRRLGLSEEQALELIPDGMAERLQFPSITLASQSTGQQFRLFIKHQPLQAQATSGKFSAYGLSQNATIPWF